MLNVSPVSFKSISASPFAKVVRLMLPRSRLAGVSVSMYQSVSTAAVVSVVVPVGFDAGVVLDGVSEVVFMLGSRVVVVVVLVSRVVSV